MALLSRTEVISFGLKVEDRLDGHVNFSAWKERIKCVFEESEVWDIVEKQPTIPTDVTLLAEFKKLNAKAKRLILDGIRDHIIPHVRGKDYAHEMWATLISLYQSSNENRKMVLREKLKTIKMTKSEGVVAYLTRINNVSDELAAIGDTVAPTELVRIAIQGLPKAWETFVDGIITRERLPNWERLWNDCVQNEIQKGYSMAVTDDKEENVAVVAKGKKGKPKKGASSNSGSKGKGKQKKKEGKERDLSKVKCWACQRMGHYAVTCIEKKNKEREK